MKKPLFNSLFLRVSSAFFLLLLIIGVAYLYITMHYSREYFDEVNQRLNRNTAKNIAEHSKPIYNNEVQQEKLGEMFNYIMEINPSLEVYLVDTSGKILAWYPKSKKIMLQNIRMEPVREFISSKGNEFITGSDPLNPRSDKIFSAASLITNGELHGFIYVVLAGKEFKEASDFLYDSYLLKLSARSMLITLIATLLIGLLIIRVITNNYSKIISVMQKFREGELSARVKVKSTGDEQQLGEIFNEMADILTANIDKLKEVENLRRELIANVSHDLRTPISIIRGYVETLQMKEETLSPEERRKYINSVNESAGRLEKLVNELFELSKLEANQVKPNKEPFNISELVSDISNKYQLIAGNKKITIDTVLSKELPPVIADVSLIERVIQNLVDNALKFTPNGGAIVIKTMKLSEKYAEVIVSDNGIGIPENEREHIFARYYRANNFTDLQNSTGLGLAIVKKILDLHDSSLDLVSKVDSGSSFIFKLPFYQNN